MWFENPFLFFFWHFRTRALSKGLSFVLKYWDLASTFYSVQQQKTLNLSWLCCEWVDAVKLLMLQEIHWVIYSAFVVLRLTIFTVFPLGFLPNCTQTVPVHKYPWKALVYNIINCSQEQCDLLLPHIYISSMYLWQALPKINNLHLVQVIDFKLTWRMEKKIKSYQVYISNLGQDGRFVFSVEKNWQMIHKRCVPVLEIPFYLFPILKP